MRSRFFVHLTAAVCLRAAAVMDRAPSLTAAGFTSTDHHVRQFLLHQARLPIQNKNSWMCQLKHFHSSCLLKDALYLTRKPDLFIYSHCRLTPGTRANGLKKHPKLQRHNPSFISCEETLSLFIIQLYFICRIKMFCYSLFPGSSDDKDFWSNF